MADNAGMYLWIFLLFAPLIGAIIDLAMTPKPTYGHGHSGTFGGSRPTPTHNPPAHLGTTPAGEVVASAPPTRTVP